MNIIGQTSSDTLKKLKFSDMSLEQAYPETSPLASQEIPQYGGEDPGAYTPQGRILYWYHPDHIQNVDLITDIDGAAYELFLYNPWGEQLHHWTSSSSSWTSPYRFNAKELDPETGLSYYGARYYQNKMGMWLSVDPMAELRESLSPYNFCSNNPTNRIDPDGTVDDDITIMANGNIEVKKTNDEFDRIFIENKSGGTEIIGQFKKNESNLIHLPSTFKFTASDGTSFGWTSHTTDSRRYISGIAAGALFGALYETGTTDISIGQFSLADGSSAPPSVSHKLGKNGDLRPLRTDGLNASTTVFDKSFDIKRNTALVTALHKYGWKDIISERNSSGNLLPFTSSAKDRKISTDHTNHFHLQGFKPSIVYK